jgi:hypothetical protein
MYIDPGAGSLVLQLILGGLAGAYVTLKIYWRRIRGRKHESPVDPADGEHTGAEHGPPPLA